MTTISEIFPHQGDNQNTKNTNRLFVYGSLMEGFFNYPDNLGGKVISRYSAKVRGLLFHQTKKGYPAIVSGDGWVIGEFLELVDFNNRISICDRVEQYFGPDDPRNEYERLVIEAILTNGRRHLAYIYFYARKDLCTLSNPAIPVPSGNWRIYMMKNPKGK